MLDYESPNVCARPRVLRSGIVGAVCSFPAILLLRLVVSAIDTTWVRDLGEELIAMVFSPAAWVWRFLTRHNYCHEGEMLTPVALYVGWLVVFGFLCGSGVAMIGVMKARRRLPVVQTQSATFRPGGEGDRG